MHRRKRRRKTPLLSVTANLGGLRGVLSSAPSAGEPMTDSAPTERDGARIHELSIAGAESYLVEPIDGGRGSAVLFLHWFDTEAPDGNRTQFLDEAVHLARQHGVVSVLPQGQFPWAGAPTDAAADADRIRAEVARHRAAIDLLAERADVD